MVKEEEMVVDKEWWCWVVDEEVVTEEKCVCVCVCSMFSESHGLQPL